MTDYFRTFLLAVIAGMVVTGFGDALAQQCVEYPDQPHLISEVTLGPGSILDLAQTETHFAIGYYQDDSSGKVAWCSFDGAGDPVLEGEYLTIRPARKVAAAGNLVFASTDGDGLFIVDFSPLPGDPSLLATIPYTGSNIPECSAAAAGNTLYLADGTQLRIFDITDPADPGELPALTLPTADMVRSVVVLDGVCWVGSWGGTFGYDVSDPAAPVLLHEDIIGAWGNQLETCGDDLAQVTTWLDGLGNPLMNVDIFDVSDPTAPVRISGKSYAGLGGFAFSATRAFLQVGGIHVADPYAGFNDLFAFSQESAGVFLPRGDLLYTASDTGLNIYSVTDPAENLFGGSIGYYSDEVTDVVLQGDRVFWSGLYYGGGSIGDVASGAVLVTNINDPLAPFLEEKTAVWSDNGPFGYSGHLAVKGDYLYTEFMGVFDWKANGKVGDFTFRGKAFIVENALLVLSFNDIQVYDITDPIAPVLSGTVALDAQNGVAGGGFMYVLSGNTLHVLDLSDPLAPVQRGSLDLTGFSLAPSSMSLADGHLYMGAGYSVLVIDVADPDSPTLSGSVTNSAEVLQVAARPGFFYVATEDGFLKVGDASIPGAPTLAPGPPSGGRSEGLVLGPESLFTFNPGSSMQSLSLDCSDPGLQQLPDLSVTLHPQDLTPIPATGGSFTYDATIGNNTADEIVADIFVQAVLPDNSVFQVARYSNRHFPAGSQTAYTGLVQEVPSGAPEGGYLYRVALRAVGGEILDVVDFRFGKAGTGALGTTEAGWRLTGLGRGDALPASSSANVILHDAAPNPFNPRTTIAFDLPAPAIATVSVYDLAGHRVKVVLRGVSLDAGCHEVIWDGTDDSGRRVASGTYFYRLDAGAATLIGRMTMVK